MGEGTGWDGDDPPPYVRHLLQCCFAVSLGGGGGIHWLYFIYGFGIPCVFPYGFPYHVTFAIMVKPKFINSVIFRVRYYVPERTQKPIETVMFSQSLAKCEPDNNCGNLIINHVNHCQT